jgi:DNA ligase (NAD+)
VSAANKAKQSTGKNTRFISIALYKTTEEKAAHLLYFVIKDHPFVDGNKRIGSFMFLLYLKSQNMPIKLNENGLVALALLVAESDPNQKGMLIRLIVNLLMD